MSLRKLDKTALSVEKKDFKRVSTLSDNIERDISELEQRVLSDVQFKGIIARALRKEFEARDQLTREEFLRFVLEHSRGDVEVLKALLLPIKKKGYPWEHPLSRRVRQRYVEKVEELMRLLVSLNPNYSVGDSFEIRGGERSDAIIEEWAEFGSAASCVMKAPRRHRRSQLCISTFFKELFDNEGRRVEVVLVENHNKRGDVADRVLDIVKRGWDERLLWELENVCERCETSLIHVKVDGGRAQVLHIGEGKVWFVGEDVVTLSEGSDVKIGKLAQHIRGKHKKNILMFSLEQFIRSARVQRGWIVVSSSLTASLIESHLSDLKSVRDVKEAYELLLNVIKEGVRGKKGVPDPGFVIMYV